jgi:cytochrome c oxidase subunit 4
MATTKFYSAIFVVLFAFATAQVAVEFAGFLDSMYWTAVGAIIVLSAIKAVLVAAYYQHLRWEPRSITSLVGVALLAALFLTAAAAYSIT